MRTARRLKLGRASELGPPEKKIQTENRQWFGVNLISFRALIKNIPSQYYK